MKELLDKLKDLDRETWNEYEEHLRGHYSSMKTPKIEDGFARQWTQGAILQHLIQDAIEAIDDWAWDLDYCSWNPPGHRHRATVWYGAADDEMEVATQCSTAAEALLVAYIKVLEEPT